MGDTDNRPIIVGGSGGSGTRALAEFLYRNGVDLPRDRTVANDCRRFTEFLRQWVEPVLTAIRRVDYRAEDLPESLRRPMSDHLTTTLEAMRASRQHEGKPRWGWTCPRTVFVLPVIAERFPDLVFVHLVRDGRDMLSSKNDNQARRFSGLLTGLAHEADPAVAIAATWTRVNLGLARYGEAVLGPRYLRLRYEDLCGPDGDARRAVLDRLGLPTRKLNGIFEASSRAGAWRREDPRAVASAHRALAPALSAFGYIDAAEAAALEDAADAAGAQPPSRVISGA